MTDVLHESPPGRQHVQGRRNCHYTKYGKEQRVSKVLF